MLYHFNFSLLKKLYSQAEIDLVSRKNVQLHTKSCLSSFLEYHYSLMQKTAELSQIFDLERSDDRSLK